MFGKRFKRKRLERRYHKLMNEAYRLSTINRAESDRKTAEANLVLEQIRHLD